MSGKVLSGIAFFYLTLLAASLHSMNVVGDVVEKTIGFVSPLVSFFVIAVLFSKFCNVEPISKTKREILAITFIAITVLEYVYPIFAYWEQTFDSSHTTLLFVELTVNSLIARVLIK